MGDEKKNIETAVGEKPKREYPEKAFEKGSIGRYFKMVERQTTLGTEIIAGLTTFLTMAYILAVNPSIIADSGGTCHACDFDMQPAGCIDNQYDPFFIPAVFTPAYEECMSNVKYDLVVVTALMSCVATFLMGAVANLPFALAPGMGLNAYFTYTVVGFRGSGPAKFETALAAVFVEGLIFIFVSAAGLRGFIVHAIPKSIKIATTGGIGLFLATLGLQTAEGIGLIVSDGATGMTLGGCSPEHRIPFFMCPDTKDIDGVPDFLSTAGPNAGFGTWLVDAGNGTYEPTDALLAYREYIGNPGGMPWESCLKGTPNVYTCDEMFDAVSKKKLGGLRQPALISGTTYLGLAGLLICGFMYQRKWKGAIIISVLLCSIISWINVEGGSVNFWEQGGNLEYFSKIVDPRMPSSVMGKLDFSDWTGVGDALFMFFFVDFMDTTGTLYAMASYADMLDKETGNFEGMYSAYLVDGFATAIGACFGTSPVTTYIESAPGILEGGRTGLTAIVVALCFGLSIFFAPILASIPPWCTGFALVVVGAMMFKGVAKINWDEPGEAIPAFILLIIMPLTYNIGYGLFAGWIAWAVINGLSLCVDFIKDFNGTKEAVQKGLSEYFENGRASLPCFWNKTVPDTKSDTKPDTKPEEHGETGDQAGEQS